MTKDQGKLERGRPQEETKVLRNEAFFHLGILCELLLCFGHPQESYESIALDIQVCLVQNRRITI
jgi:hypothetical protein